MENLETSFFSNIFSTILEIINHPSIQYPLAIVFIIIGTITIVGIVYSILKSYFHAKRTGKKISWMNILEDIKWTLYDYSERDKEYVMSLPRLIYFISAILIIYVVLADKPNMLSPLLGFNLSAMVSYTSKKYIERKEEKEEFDSIIGKFNDIKDIISGESKYHNSEESNTNTEGSQKAEFED